MMTQRVGVSSLTLGRALGIAGLLWMTGGLVATVTAETTDPGDALTTADGLAQLESESATITDVNLTPTEAGLTLTIAANGVLPTPTLETLGNAQIITIPNTVLSLPTGEERFDSQPAEGIAAVAVSTDGNAVRLAITGSEAPPEVTLNRESPGLVVQVRPGSASPVAAEPEDPLQIIITASRREEEVQQVPRSVTVIPREEIEAQTNLSRNLQDILGELIPGFGASPQRNFLTGQNLRGRRPLVLIDGVPQTSNFRAPLQELNTIDPAAIDRIEVVRGPTAIYGSEAAGGVINIITRTPEEEGISARTELAVDTALTGSDNSVGNFQEQSFSLREGNTALQLSLARSDAGNFFDADGNLLPTAEGDDNTETLDVLGKVQLDLSEQQQVQFTVNYFQSDQERDFVSDPVVQTLPGIQPARALELDPVFIDYSLQPLENTVISLGYSHDALLGSQVDVQAYFRKYNTGQGIPSNPFPFLPDFIFASNTNSQQWGGRLSIDSSLSEEFSLLWGADYVNELSSQDLFLFDPGPFNASGGRVFELSEVVPETPPYAFESLGLYGQLQWQPSQQFILTGGVRHERAGFSVNDYTNSFIQLLAGTFFPQDFVEGGSRSFSDTVFNLGAVYRPSDDISLFASFAQGFSIVDIGRALRFPQGVASVESDFPQIEPQIINNYEIGLRGNWDTVQTSLSAFYNQSDQGASLQVRDGFLQIVRAPERIYGVEATVDWQPSETWRLGGSLSWQDGNFDEDNDGDFLAIDSGRISPIKATAYVENQTLPGWRNRLQLLVLGDRDRAFDDGSDPVTIDGFVTVDYISSIQIGNGTLEIGIENLFNEQYFPIFSQLQGGFGNEVENAAARGRNLRIGYRLTW